MVKLPLSVAPVPLTSVYVCVSPVSASVVENVPTTVPIVSFSATLETDNAKTVGGLFGVAGGFRVG